MSQTTSQPIADQSASHTASPVQQPNYRIYDRTGGGVTEDIYAEMLEDAIEQGREWIEAGDWSGDEQDGTYRTIALDCCVREIVRVPDLRSIEALPAVYDVSALPDGSIRVECGPETVLSMLPGCVVDGSVMDADGYYDVVLGDVALPTMIDEEATSHGQSWDCSGSYTPEEPECDADNGEEHDWTSDDGAPVGGCRENPGVHSLGGTRMSFRACCRHCGRYRVETDPGCQRNSDEALLTVTIEDGDEASEAWVRKLRGENDEENIEDAGPEGTRIANKLRDEEYDRLEEQFGPAH